MVFIMNAVAHQVKFDNLTLSLGNTLTTRWQPIGRRQPFDNSLATSSASPSVQVISIPAASDSLHLVSASIYPNPNHTDTHLRPVRICVGDNHEGLSKHTCEGRTLAKLWSARGALPSDGHLVEVSPCLGAVS